MSGSGTTTITPGKRFTDDAETFAIADLNSAGQPIMQLDAQSIGADEFITDDLVDMIKEQTLGLRVTYTFPVAYSLPFLGSALVFAKVPFLGVRPGDPIWCNQVPGLPCEIDAQVDLPNQVSFRGLPANGMTGVSFPAGTTVTAIVFTSKRQIPRGTPGGPPTPLITDSGYLQVDPGKVWAPGEPIVTTGLDQMVTGMTATVKPASIGRREVIPEELEKLTAPIVGGLPFKARFPNTLTVAPNGETFPFTVAVPGALTTQVAVMGNRELFDPLRWIGYVTAANTVAVYVKNLTATGQLITKRSKVQGRLI